MTEKMFQCMLASTEIPLECEIKFPLLASYKYDGFRALPKGQPSVPMRSRKMIEVPNLFVQAWAADNYDTIQHFDGELIVGEATAPDVFNKAQKALTRADGEPDFTYYVFELADPHSEDIALTRYNKLKAMFAVQSIARCVLVEQFTIKNIAELKALYAKALALGYEGLILKSPFSKYKNGRSTLNEGILLKWKEFIDSEAVVLSVNQGTKNNNELTKDNLGHAKRSSAKAGKAPKETIGSFNAKDIHTGIEFRCAPGSLSEAELKALFLARDTLPGKVFTYKSQKMPLAGKPRFPGFKGWRSDIDYQLGV